jgi:hypothetical protein
MVCGFSRLFDFPANGSGISGVVAIFNAQRAKEIETLVERRQSTHGNFKKCIAEWVKPSMLSKETAEDACAAKRADYKTASDAVKARETKTCGQGDGIHTTARYGCGNQWDIPRPRGNVMHDNHAIRRPASLRSSLD